MEKQAQTPQEVFNELVADCVKATEGLDTTPSLQTHLARWESTEEDADCFHPWLSALSVFRSTWFQLKKHPEALETFKQRVREQAIALTANTEYVFAKSLCTATRQDFNMLYDHAKGNGIFKADGSAHYILEEALHKYGTVSEVDIALSQNPLRTDDRERNSSRVYATLKPIRKMVRECLELSGLSSREPAIYGYQLLPTAAMQLQGQGYDHVVGIVNGGSILPNYMRPLGQNVSYLEYHRHWKQAPRWRAKRQMQEIREGMKVLLCEHDAVSGHTLRAAMWKLDKTSPSSVDLCFTGPNFSKSKDIAEKVGGFDMVFHLTDVDQSRVFSDMLEYRRILNKALGRHKKLDMKL